jgi:hypothetical protein
LLKFFVHHRPFSLTGSNKLAIMLIILTRFWIKHETENQF